MEFNQRVPNCKSRRSTGITACAVSLLFLLSGCGSGTVSKSTSTPLAGLTGRVYGGQQPVSDARIQLYAAGASGDGSSATALITQTVTSSDGSGNATNSNANAGNGNNSLPPGSFTLAGDYQCPSSEAEVYAVATGGNPGLTAGTNNKALALMAALGSCGNLGSSTTVTINELTTISSVASLAGFTKSYLAVGSSTSDWAQLQAAFAMVNEYANVSAGTVPGPALPTGDYASSTEIQTLGDAVASCVNSYGGVAGDGSDCGQLFALATPLNGTAPTDTVKAVLNILTNPTENVCSIFNLSGASSAFTPTLPACPTNWDLPILPMAAAPTFSVSSGSYTTVQTVTISDSVSGATIYYTTDGTTPSASSSRYTSAIAVSSSETIQAIAVATGHGPSAIASATYTINLPAVATPTFAPAGGTYTSNQVVTISDSTSGASIYYTTDGSTPTTSSPKYSGGISVTSSETIKAIAVATGYNQSPLASAAYTINIPQVSAPAFSIGSGTYTAIQTVTISDSTSGATIYYTTNGATPTTSSTKYAVPITVATTEMLQAMAIATGYQQSPTTTASYTISLPTAAKPVFSLPSGTYTSVQSVSISDATSGATIYYTTDGSIPTTASVKYSSAISVSAAETLQAIAVATGYIQSAVASATYTVSIPKATLTLSASPNPQGVGEAVLITANVTVVNSQASTAGTFNIVADGNTICSGTTNTPTGYSCSVTTLAQGTHNLSATYIGTYNGGLQANAGPISIVIMPVMPTPTWFATTAEVGSPPFESYYWQLFLSDSNTASNVVIGYTTDGSVPSCSSSGTIAHGTVYVDMVANGGFIGENIGPGPETVRAIACASGYMPSAVLTIALNKAG